MMVLSDCCCTDSLRQLRAISGATAKNKSEVNRSRSLWASDASGSLNLGARSSFFRGQLCEDLYIQVGPKGALPGSKLWKLAQVIKKGYIYELEGCEEHLAWFTQGMI